MSLVEVKDLKFKYQTEELFNNVSFRVLNNDHIVILGENGSGKSTFMKILSLNLSPDKGSVLWLNNTTFSYLDQQLTVKEDLSIEDYLLSTYKSLFDLEKKMNEYYNLAALNPDRMDKYLSYADSISQELDKADFYTIDAKIKNVLAGLGLLDYDLNTKLKILSSGTRAKVYLAKILLDTPDVILLDEPTNFLDEAHVLYLISYLKSYKKSFVVISHDIAFVRPIATVIYELKNKELIRYNMDYDHYLIESKIREDNYKKAYENQQAFIKKTTEFINKNIVRATTTKRAQSRRKMLEKIKILEKPTNSDIMNISFPFSSNLGQDVLKITDLSIGYNNKIILDNINLLIEHNKKVVILGRNGVGKSTFLKTILGLIPQIKGEYKWTDASVINYYAQEEKYNRVTPINYLRYYYPTKTDGELRTILAKVGIKGDLAIKKMTELSGGQQTKVRLALMSMKKSNILVLDEPTNHLDVSSKASLYEAIDDFPGSVILVTHEDDFYEGLVDLVINFE